MIQSYYRRRRPEVHVPGLVRIDRAILFIGQHLRRLLQELEARQTKTLGEGEYVVSRTIDQIAAVCQMSGDLFLLDGFMPSMALIARTSSSRTPKQNVIKAINDCLNDLDAYEPNPEIAYEDSSSLAESLADGSTKATPSDLAKNSSVFVIMPFGAEFNDVWKGGIQPAAKASGFHPIRVDTINRSSNITDDIVDSMNACHIAVVDVTGNNPNVMYELGYVMALGKPYVIMSQSVDYLPFDIRNIRTIVYENSWSGIEELRSKLNDFLKEFPSQSKVRATARRTPKKTTD